MAGNDRLGSKDGANSNKANTESTFSHYAWEIALTLPLFMRGKKGALLSAALNGLHDINTRDGAVGGIEDFTVGAARGYLTQRTMERLGVVEWKGSLAAPSKGAAFGAVNRALGGINLQNYRDQSSGEITSKSVETGLTNYTEQFNFGNSQIREAWVLDMASYSAVAAVSYGLNKGNKGALARNPLAANMFAAGTIGLMSGAGGEIINEHRQGTQTDWTKVALAGGTELGVQLAASKIGYQLEARAGSEGSIMLPSPAQRNPVVDDVGPPRTIEGGRTGKPAALSLLPGAVLDAPVQVTHEIPVQTPKEGPVQTLHEVSVQEPHETPVQLTHEPLVTVIRDGEGTTAFYFEDAGSAGRQIATISISSRDLQINFRKGESGGWEISRKGGGFKPDSAVIAYDEAMGTVTCKYPESTRQIVQEVFHPDGKIDKTLNSGATFVTQGKRVLSSIDVNGKTKTYHWTNVDGEDVITAIDTPDYSEKEIRPGVWSRLDLKTGAITESAGERTVSTSDGQAEEHFPPGSKTLNRKIGLNGRTYTEVSEGYGLTHDSSGKLVAFDTVKGATKVSWDSSTPPRVMEFDCDDGTYSKRLGDWSWEIREKIANGFSTSVRNGMDLALDPDGTLRTSYDTAGKSGKDVVEIVEHFDLTREEHYADQSVKYFGRLKNVTVRADGSQLEEFPVPGSSYERNANEEIIRTWQSDGRQVAFNYEGGKPTRATVYDTSGLPVETYTGDLKVNGDGSYSVKGDDGTWTTHTTDGGLITDSRTNALKVGELVDVNNSQDIGLLKVVRRGKLQGPDGTQVDAVIRPFDPTSRNNLLKVRQAQIYSNVTQTLELGSGEPICIVRELKLPDGSTKPVFVQEDAGESWGSYLRDKASEYSGKPLDENDGSDFVAAIQQTPGMFEEVGDMLYEPVLFGNHDLTELSNSARRVLSDNSVSSKMIDNKENFTTADIPSFSDRAGYPGQSDIYELYGGKRLSEISPALQARADHVVELLHLESTRAQLQRDGLSEAEINSLTSRAEKLAENGYPQVVSIFSENAIDESVASSAARAGTEQKFNSITYRDVQANNNGIDALRLGLQ